MYYIYEIKVSSNIPLPLSESTETSHHEADVFFYLRDNAEITEKVPPKAVLLVGQKNQDGKDFASYFKINNFYLFRYHGMMDFYISRSGRFVRF